MTATRARNWWIAAGVLLVMLTGFFTARLLGDDRRVFVPNEMTHGHYQIELACEACHTPFAGVKQEACEQCHGAELAAANDSHPRKKFDDPRNADRLGAIDARRCVACHVEHQPDRTRPMAVTQPDDFCFHCHAEVATERPSHKDYAFNGCASGGCHNYHDNTALYEDFLLKHLDEPAMAARPHVPARDLRPWIEAVFPQARHRSLTARDADGPAPMAMAHVDDWAASGHARAGVNCRDCHQPAAEGVKAAWRDRPGIEVCASCHEGEQRGFLAGRHGMRLERKLPPMRPEMARASMKTDAHGRELGCGTCHGAHRVDTRHAAVAACLECHDDRHTRAYRDSKHAALWQAELAGRGAPGSGVSCATCHLPREHRKDGELAGVRVQHNQNANLRPNEKMARGVCLQCHGLGFTLDALADAELVQRNFTGRPARHVESLDLAAARLRQPRKPQK